MNDASSTPTRELLFWAFAIVCGALVLLSPVACTINRQHVIAEAVKNGADPVAMKCGIESDTSSTPMCVAYALKAKP